MNNEPLFILLADDDESDRLLFTDALSELEINLITHTVTNGMELMTYLTEENARLPHIIFLDLNMPRKNGLDCLKEIRSNEKLKNISVAIYSTSNNEKDMEKTFLNGANIYISKPDDFNILKQFLYKAITTSYLYKKNDMNIENFLMRIQ